MSIRLRLSFCHRIPYIRHHAHPLLPQNENGRPEKLKRENCIKVGILLFAGYVEVLQALRNHAVAVAILARVGVKTRMKTKRQGLVVLQIKPVGSASR